MHLLPALSLVTLGLVTLTSASPANPFSHSRHVGSDTIYPRQQDGTANASTPCSKVSSTLAEADTGVATQVTIPAKLAYDCLMTIPLNDTEALSLIENMKPYINWQSTLAYLRAPPAEYIEKVQEPVDILEGLDELAQRVKDKKYTSDYEFSVDLYTLLQSAHDGHLTFITEAVGALFYFARPIALVSVSEDGYELPAVFGYQDVVARHFDNATYKPSAISQINGEDVYDYLEDWSQHGSLQDRDALYNSNFFSLAQASLGRMGGGTGMFSGDGRGRFVYPGAETKLTFENGTSRTYENFARPRQAFRNIKNGEDVVKSYYKYRHFELSPETGGARLEVEEPVSMTSPSINVRQSAPFSVVPAGFPSPILSYANIISGYYLEGKGYDDVAVLFVPNFVSGTERDEFGFQSVSDKFLQDAKAAGKTKLIIDVQANGGGTILQGYDLFKKLFPFDEPYGANRFRATEALDTIGKAFSEVAGQYERAYGTLDAEALDYVGSPFNYRTDTDQNQNDFTSWDDKYGPVKSYEDKFTNLLRWNLSDPLLPYFSGGINITGHGNRTNWTEQPFKAEDIVVITDGYCASTCTLFSEFMRQQAGVKNIAFGGRANTDPMQAVGGVKGSNNLPWEYLQQFASMAVEGGAKRADGLEGYFNTQFKDRSAVPAGVNVRDGIREGDVTETPLQFVYEEADCRIYYTPEMTIDIRAVWKAAADAQWNNDGKCVGEDKATFGKRDATKRLSQRHVSPMDGINEEQLIKAMEIFTDVEGMDMEARGFMMP